MKEPSHSGLAPQLILSATSPSFEPCPLRALSQVEKGDFSAYFRHTKKTCPPYRVRLHPKRQTGWRPALPPPPSQVCTISTLSKAPGNLCNPEVFGVTQTSEGDLARYTDGTLEMLVLRTQASGSVELKYLTRRLEMAVEMTHVYLGIEKWVLHSFCF